MANPFDEVSVSGYNSSPPSDDGQQVASNEIEWQKHLDKIGAPLKTAIESTQTNITAAFNKRLANNTLSKSANYTVATGDDGKLIQFSAAATATLPAVATVSNNFAVGFENTSASAVLTVDGDGSETIGGDTTIDVAPGQIVWILSNGTAWFEFFNSFGKLRNASQTESATADPAIAASDYGRIILADASGGAFSVTAAAVATLGDGFKFTLIKVDSSSNAVTFDPNASETIDGATTLALSTQYEARTFVCDGSEWFTQSKSVPGVFTQTRDIFASTNSSWPIPSGVKRINFEVQGGGGGGDNDQPGGGGGFIKGWIDTDGKSTLNVTVGTGGAGAASGAGNGGLSSVSDGTFTWRGNGGTGGDTSAGPGGGTTVLGSPTSSDGESIGASGDDGSAIASGSGGLPGGPMLSRGRGGDSGNNAGSAGYVILDYVSEV